LAAPTVLCLAQALLSLAQELAAPLLCLAQMIEPKFKLLQETSQVFIVVITNFDRLMCDTKWTTKIKDGLSKQSVLTHGY